MNNYNNACSEVYSILERLNEEDYKKIPKDIIEAIYENRNKTYEYKMFDNVELEECTLLPETKAILFNLFRDYLCEEWQREKILKMQEKERMEEERKKQIKYNSDIFYKNKEKAKEIPNELVKYNERMYEKIIRFFKNIFNFKKPI